MAKYIGTLTSDMRGKVGGLVFTKGRNGTNLKAQRIPVNTASALQVSRRAVMSAASVAWAALTNAQQLTWSILSSGYTYLNSLAQAYSPTGQQLWTQAFINASYYGQVPPSTAPSAPPAVGAITNIQCLGDGTYLEFFAQQGGSYYTAAWRISGSITLRTGQNYIRSLGMKPLGQVAASNLITATTSYAVLFGSLPAEFANIAVKATPLDYSSFISGTPLKMIVNVEV